VTKLASVLVRATVKIANRKIVPGLSQLRGEQQYEKPRMMAGVSVLASTGSHITAAHSAF
jgi:hypothetical protein